MASIDAEHDTLSDYISLSCTLAEIVARRGAAQRGAAQRSEQVGLLQAFGGNLGAAGRDVCPSKVLHVLDCNCGGGAVYPLTIIRLKVLSGRGKP
eukprot:6211423-Pleurochrysis_carterae.AAC.1